MSNTVVKVENVSKQYRLGQVSTGTIAHDVNRFWHKIRGKEDPYLKVGESNDRTTKGSSDYVWVLNDLNFEIQKGDTVGIIGKNGAGKSTLLKILSRVTTPTSGQIKVKGRIASLLEVGTGFHPELSGRDNIFLNGAILGMTKHEIKSKFDEIVQFSGVERYIDTPVKRYSSGMYVRLAFAVAAHLETEILIIDEVLAVGDAEFQKKCLGKMSDVAGDGRTVIFVSHNMQAVQSLCKKALYLKNGNLQDYGNVNDIITNYISKDNANCLERSWLSGQEPGNKYLKLTGAVLNPQLESENAAITVKTGLHFVFQFQLFVDCVFNLSLLVNTASGTCVFNVGTQPEHLKGSRYQAMLEVPANLLNDDIYNISLYFIKDTSVVMFSIEELLVFEVEDEVRNGNWYGKWPGIIRPELKFVLSKQ